MKETINMRWIESQQHYSKKVGRKDLIKKFQKLIENYPMDNEISKKLVKIIPAADYIQIDKDLNGTQDVPCITYKIDGAQGMLKIIRHHKLVWQTLNECCQN